jgi:hypothetical protein
MQKEAVRFGLNCVRDLGAEAEYRFYPAQGANAHAEVNDYQVRKFGEVYSRPWNTFGHFEHSRASFG